MSDMSLPPLRPDWRRLQKVYRDGRTAEQITEHYLLERDLAARLRAAPPESRQRLYGELYSELFARLPHHPRFTRRQSASHGGKQVAVLRKLVGRDATFLEIGAGDCSVALAMAPFCRSAIAVDVTEPETIAQVPANFRFALTDGLSMPIPSSSVDFAYSHQLMEHLHPDDAARQLRDIHRSLRPGGVYFCITPSRLTGPHDVSRFFDNEARGFHLKEYTYRDFDRLFADTGFVRLRACIARGRYYAGAVPLRTATAAEDLFALLPLSARRRLGTSRWTRSVLGLALLAYKPDKS